MPAPRALARFNKKVTNRLLGRVATRLPGFGVVTHRGRRYRTPINVFRTPNGYCAALIYGVQSDWVLNVLAADGCELDSRGRHQHLSSPRLVHDESRREAPPPVRPILRLIGVTDFLRLTPTDPHRGDTMAAG